RERLKKARSFAAAGPAWKDYVLQEVGPFAGSSTDEELDDMIPNIASTIWHIVGTAAMTSYNAIYGVVNPNLRINGVKGLRIVDASVFPFIPSAHTQAPVYAFAERAVDLIKAAWK
ncbi:GMC oxidoreductase, partial [Sphaerobolus stellatus SS14]